MVLVAYTVATPDVVMALVVLRDYTVAAWVRTRRAMRLQRAGTVVRCVCNGTQAWYDLMLEAIGCHGVLLNAWLMVCCVERVEVLIVGFLYGAPSPL